MSSIYEAATLQALQRAREALHGDDPDEVRTAAAGLVACTGLLLSRLALPNLPAVEAAPSESWWRRFALPWSRPTGRHHVRPGSRPTTRAVDAPPAVARGQLAIAAEPEPDDAPTIVIDADKIREAVAAS